MESKPTKIPKCTTGSGKNTITDPLLEKLDSTALFAIGIGVLLTAIIGISTAINSYSNKEKNMNNENTIKTQKVQSNERINHATKIQSPEATRSFNGAVRLQAQSQQTTSNNTSNNQTSTANNQSANTQNIDKN